MTLHFLGTLLSDRSQIEHRLSNELNIHDYSIGRKNFVNENVLKPKVSELQLEQSAS